MTNDPLRQLQTWYASQSDGVWEEDHGIDIGTLSNPGWRIAIDLRETDLAESPFIPVKEDRTDDDWVSCRVEEGRFQGRCGPENLSEILQIFVVWVRAEQLR